MVSKRKKNKISKQNRRKGVFSRNNLAALFFILFAGSVLAYAVVRFGDWPAFEFIQPATSLSRPTHIYHGPHPNTELTTIASGAVLGQERANVQKSAAVRKKKAQKKPYGIAAGGGLVGYSQKSLNKYFKSLKSLGVQWVRWDIDWSVVQPDNSENFDWEATDRVAATAKKYGINSLGIITYTPKWAAVEPCDSDTKCEPANPEAFGRFAGIVAARYRNSITHWEIWNEPNITPFWEPEPNAENYAEILREAYVEIKKENPQAVVLSGGLAITGDEPDGDISSVIFMQKIYELGANQYFDAAALHPYTYPVLPNYQAEWNNWQELLEMRQLMEENGEGSKKIWITEFGAPTGGSGNPRKANQYEKFRFGADYMKKSAQRDILKEATSFYREHSDWMGPFFWYSLRDSGTSRSDTENFFGLLDYKGKKKPAYKVFKQVIKSKK